MKTLRALLLPVLAVAGFCHAGSASAASGRLVTMIRNVPGCGGCAVSAVIVASVPPAETLDRLCVENPVLETVRVKNGLRRGIFLRGAMTSGDETVNALIFMTVPSPQTESRLIVGTFCLPRWPRDDTLILGGLVGNFAGRKPKQIKFEELIRDTDLTERGPWSVFGSAIAGWPTIEIIASPPPATIEVPNLKPQRAGYLKLTASPEDIAQTVVRIGNRTIMLKNCPSSPVNGRQRYNCR